MANANTKPIEVSLVAVNPVAVPKVVEPALPGAIPAGRTSATAAQVSNTPGTRYLIGDTGHAQAPSLAAGSTSLERRVTTG